MNTNDTQLQPAALLVHTCDRYRFLYPGFNYFFNLNWDFKTNCRYYFATEEVNIDLPHFQNIHSGRGEWSDRLRFLLQEVITEKYVFYFQEDMWLQKPVSNSFMNELITLAQQFDWQQVKLGSADIYKTRPTPYYIDGFNVSVLDNEASDYLMSHQVTLWNKDFLLQQLHKGEHPWRNERRGTKRLKKLDPEIFHIDYFAENGQAAININLTEAVRSEYHTVSANSMLQANVLPYVQQLQEAGEEEKAYAAQLLIHYENRFTHDGLPKPHKQDIFKKMKNLFR